MRYPTPRGEVIGRLVAWDEDGHTSSAQALCTFDSEELAPVCERVVGSLSHR